MKIELLGKGKGKYVLIDDKDFDLVKNYKWYLSNWGYAVGGRNGSIRMHRLILDAKKGEQVDHISMDRLDNRRFNLRIATASQNKLNQPKRRDNTSGYKGVSFSSMREGYYAAYITKDQKHKFLGHFKNKIEAAKAYDRAAFQLYGNFAQLNFKKEVA